MSSGPRRVRSGNRFELFALLHEFCISETGIRYRCARAFEGVVHASWPVNFVPLAAAAAQLSPPAERVDGWRRQEVAAAGDLAGPVAHFRRASREDAVNKGAASQQQRRQREGRRRRGRRHCETPSSQGNARPRVPRTSPRRMGRLNRPSTRLLLRRSTTALQDDWQTVSLWATKEQPQPGNTGDPRHWFCTDPRVSRGSDPVRTPQRDANGRRDGRGATSNGAGRKVPSSPSHLQRFPKDARGKVATGKSGSRVHQLAASRVKVDVHAKPSTSRLSSRCQRRRGLIETKARPYERVPTTRRREALTRHSREHPGRVPRDGAHMFSAASALVSLVGLFAYSHPLAWRYRSALIQIQPASLVLHTMITQGESRLPVVRLLPRTGVTKL